MIRVAGALWQISQITVFKWAAAVKVAQPVVFNVCYELNLQEFNA
jgi:hypothetical protein